ncbi:ribosome biogenesis factor YjgA [Psychrobium sp. 1_MG-2023]|uniref:ribosome biogenesis factor YjgA n=1 Tax=Psychrobium sp. 1_MG-2023 TaxID=3062624 RepID=UPI000C333B39|nr:ribosome biogenesis factor YjgA [Psychrobium sp. 1_MG-2023]MDP2560710.1 ribosome biogenesis factor YjgA [Psychrobium sp. 1_MG-2023]PKF56604.1 hypothetical protein CW748_08965 [Alteromonadales bacterium alter-6D02]
MSKAKKATIEVGSDLDDWVSRSELKRQAEDYHSLGRTIMALSDSQRASLPMSDELQAAVTLANRIRHTKEGFRRQMQLVAKVLRNSDVDGIRTAIEQFKHRDKRADLESVKLEKLRDRIIKQGDSAVNEFLEQHPSADRQKLRQLTRQAAKEVKAEKPAKSFKELFKYIKSFNEQD